MHGRGRCNASKQQRAPTMTTPARRSVRPAGRPVTLVSSGGDEVLTAPTVSQSD